MEKQQAYLTTTGALGKAAISEDIIARVAINAASDTDGVAEPSQHFSKSAAEERHRNAQHVSILFSEGEITVNMFIAVLIGRNIQEVAAAVQSAVSAAVQTACGATPKQVNVNVTRVRFE
ncbi:MAG: Asp23/Gls24 family envelope stress response protein [Oscillospiraceae bacterium]|jgi:uncharacterized alkaline shock family protein YloU|nr:Asp23/Gls24 family envelope stress response protein [Oscillospiraceae bacterium]